MRVGHGYDAHTFIEGKPLVLGGVTIPYDKGLKAHSDGDAVIHSLCDAILGAAAMGDIGTYYPDTDDKYKNIDSRLLLRDIIKKIKEKGYKICNADITILAQAPRLLPYVKDMRQVLSEDMNISIDDINVKATTTEGMGFVGRGEGICVYANVILDK